VPDRVRLDTHQPNQCRANRHRRQRQGPETDPDNSAKGFRFVGSVTEQLHDIQPADAPPKESQPRSALPLPDRPAAYAQFVRKNYHDAIGLSREAIRQRSDFAGAYRVLTVAAGTAGQIEVAAAALKELRRAQPNISLAWIANLLPWKLDSDREHYLEAFRRAGLD
jgi:hypothetical protein